jgi:LacI family transcriptional regulator
LDRIPDRVPVDSVSIDDAAAAEMGVRHLIDMGARRIAIVTGPMALKNERHRLDGYRQALERAGIAVDEKLIWPANLRPDDVAALCREQLAGSRPRPDAIFSTNGPTALGVLRAFRDCGLETPRDIAFVTFDELTVEDLFSPAITTVVQPAFDIGYRAADLLLDRIGGVAPAESVTVRLPAMLRVRDSSRRVSTNGKSTRAE